MHGAKAQPREGAPQDLPIEIRAGHGHHAAMAPPPHSQENRLVPKRINAAAVLAVHAIDVLPSQDFIAQGRPDGAGEAVCRGRNNRDLGATESGKLFGPGIIDAGVVVGGVRRRFGQLGHAL